MPIHEENATIAKIARPKYSRVLKRDRLFRLLDDGIHQTLIWVAGPAGSGKTALVSSYLKERSFPHLWYRLDERDEDLSAFFHYIRLAAENAAPGQWPPLPALGARNLPGISAFAGQFFEALCVRLTPPFALVFDDYHELGANWTIRNIFNKALSAIPEGVCCILISRSEPEAEFARIASYGRMHAIGWNALRFTLDETKELARQESPAGMSDTQIERIHRETGGWAAGLTIAMEAVRDGNITDALMGKLSGDRLFDYFTAEILERMDPSVRSFLLSTAFLPEVTVRTAETLTACGNAGEILSGLHRNNFFTRQSDSELRVYAYHPLFHDFLRAYARRSLETGTLDRIRARAAKIMEDEGRIDEAIDLHIEQKDWQNAVRLLLAHAMAALIQGRPESFEKRLARLPAAVRESTPYLELWQGMFLLSENSRESRSHLENAFCRFEAGGDMVGALMAWSGAVESIFIELGDMRRMDPWVRWLDGHFGEETVFFAPEIRMMVVRSMLGVLSQRQPDHPRALYWIAEAEALLDSELEMNSRVLLAARLYYYYSIMEENSRANMVFKRSEPAVDPNRLQLLTHLWWRFLVLDNSRYTAWQTRESCEDYFENVRQALSFSRDLGIRAFDELNLAFGAHAALVVRDLDTFDEMLGRLKGLLHDSNPLTHIIYHLYFGLKLFFIGDHVSAREQGNIGLRLSESIGTPINQYRSHVLLFCSHVGLQALETAEAHFLEMRRIGKSIPHLRHEGIHLLMQAYMLHKAGDIRKAKKRLAAGLKKVKQENTIHSAFWFPSVLTDLCANALDADIEVAYVQDVVRRTRLVPGSSETVSENWPFAVRIYSLGRFDIEIDGKPLDFAGRVPQKPLALLKTIIAFGRPEVPMEQIADAMWPDVDGDAAHSNFTTNLNRLRRLLGFEETVRFRSGKVSLDPQLCWVDVRRFLYILDELEAVYRQCDRKSASKDTATSDSFFRDRLIRLTDSALSLYRGPFLEDEPRHPQAMIMREGLRTRHIRLILTTGKYLEEAGQYRSAADLYLRGLETDALVEEFYRQLMTSYLRMGLKGDAVGVFKRCEKTLMDAFGVKPSEGTRRIYQSLF